jgi:hypothetical protein
MSSGSSDVISSCITFSFPFLRFPFLFFPLCADPTLPASRCVTCTTGCLFTTPFERDCTASFELGPTTVPERVRPGRELAGPTMVDAREVNKGPLVSEVAGRTKSDARMVPARFRLCLAVLVFLELMPGGLWRERVRIGSWISCTPASWFPPVRQKKKCSVVTMHVLNVLKPRIRSAARIVKVKLQMREEKCKGNHVDHGTVMKGWSYRGRAHTT